MVVRGPVNLKVIDQCVVQKYISKPHLMDGYKYTIKFFVLAKSLDPMRLYVYNDAIITYALAMYDYPHKMNPNPRESHFVKELTAAQKRELGMTFDVRPQTFKNLLHVFENRLFNRNVAMETRSRIYQMINRTFTMAPGLFDRSCLPSWTDNETCF